MSVWNKNKYHAKQTVLDGIRFASKSEALRWRYLKDLEKLGMISDLKRQVKFPLAICIDGTDYVIRSQNGHCRFYLADFEYTDLKTKKKIVEDVKGIDTPVSKLKRDIVKAFYGVIVHIVKNPTEMIGDKADE